MKHFCLHDEQTVNGLRKITWASIFHFLFETAAYTFSSVFRIDTYTYTYICCHVHIYIYSIYVCTENGTNRKWHLFAAKRKTCLLKNHGEITDKCEHENDRWHGHQYGARQGHHSLSPCPWPSYVHVHVHVHAWILSYYFW
jgi:hypothetical protein